MPVTNSLKQLGDEVPLLRHFNDFHDSFIKSIQITSRDNYTAKNPTERIITREFDAVIIFSHSNYPGGENRSDRAIEARFSDVGSININFEVQKSEFSDWTIDTLRFPNEEQHWALEAEFSFFTSGKNWKKRKKKLFSFATAEFKEINLPEMVESPNQ